MQKKPTKIKRWLQRMALKTLFPVDQNRGWIPIVQEAFSGAFQQDETISLTTSMSHPTVYACVSQIAYDIGKLGLRITKKSKDGIYLPVENNAYSQLLNRPNNFQIRQKFLESWMTSLLTNGNTYVLKARNARKQVVKLYILDPNRVEPLVSEDGSVFYRLKKDDISGVHIDIDAIPAYEIIHDTMITLFHPLIGVPPLYAAYRAIAQGLAIQNYSANFFTNRAQPSGILTAPGHVKKEVADQIREAWSSLYSGDNVGKIAVIGDGLEYKQLGENAEDSQLVEQLGWSDEKICSVFKVPPYKVHVGKAPTYEQSETLDRKYYSDCLQRHIESIENLLDEGLSLPSDLGTQFDLDDLMRMDMSLKMKTASEGVKGGIVAPNEARRRFDLPPVKGGDTPYMQQQNYSLAALDERDKTNPLAVQQVTPATEIVEDDEDETEEEEAQKWLIGMRTKDNIIGVYK